MILKVGINVNGGGVCFNDSIQGKLEEKNKVRTQTASRPPISTHRLYVCMFMYLYIYKHAYITTDGVDR